MRINREIRAPQVRLIDAEGKQMGVVSRDEAMRLAEVANLDLVEVASTAEPPVCKIIDYGKLRYNKTKKEREGRKGTHQGKVKEVKFKPNISDHDFGVKVRHAREFIAKGHKVKVTCMFRGREMARKELGRQVIQRLIDELEDIASPDAPLKLLGRNLTTMISPGARKKKEKIVATAKEKDSEAPKNL